MEKKEEILVYDMEASDKDSFVYETSLVSDPATGFEWLRFKKEDNTKISFKKVLDAENPKKRMISGLWFLPDTPLKRIDANGELYATKITREELFKAFENYLKRGDRLFQFEHNGIPLKGVIDVENWVYTEDNKLSPVYGLSLEDLGYDESKVPYGSVFKTVYIEDEEFWNEYIESGKLTGFSIGGLFNLKEAGVINSTEAFSNNNNINLNNLQKMKKQTKFSTEDAINALGDVATPEVAIAIAELIEEVADVTTEEVVKNVEEVSNDNERLDAIEAKLDQILSILMPVAEKVEVVVDEAAAVAESYKKQTEKITKLAETFRKQTPMASKEVYTKKEVDNTKGYIKL